MFSATANSSFWILTSDSAKDLETATTGEIAAKEKTFPDLTEQDNKSHAETSSSQIQSKDDSLDNDDSLAKVDSSESPIINTDESRLSNLTELGYSVSAPPTSAEAKVSICNIHKDLILLIPSAFDELWRKEEQGKKREAEWKIEIKMFYFDTVGLAWWYIC